MRSVTLIIPGDPLELSPNARLHPYVRRKLVREWKARTFDAWEKAGRPRLTPPVVICFLIYRARACDQDNAAASLKPVTDALTDRGCPYGPALIPDDSAKRVSYLPVLLAIASEAKGCEHVRVRVMETEEDAETDEAYPGDTEENLR